MSSPIVAVNGKSTRTWLTHQVKLSHTNNVSLSHWHIIVEPVNLCIWIRVDETINFRFEAGRRMYDWLFDAYFGLNWACKTRGNHWLSFNAFGAHTNQKHLTTHNLQRVGVQPMRLFQYHFPPHTLSRRPCRNASHRPYNDACRCLAKPHAVHYAATELWVEEYLWLRMWFEKSHRVWCSWCPMGRFWPLAPLRWKEEWMRRAVFNQ